ncbi:MAG: lipid-binding SYLF domain-containing protein [Gammaproteobacteria bacterium]
MMRRYLQSILFCLSMALLSLNSHAALTEEQRLARATEVLQQMTLMPESGIPPVLLRRAQAVIVVPNLIKGGFFIGGRHGRGVMVIKSPNGEWSNPSFVALSGGSFGWQFGAQSTDLVLVFKNRGAADNIVSGKLTLGGQASIAAGPVGRNTEAATDLRFQAEVYTYSRNRGLFIGASVEGASLRIDDQANRIYYGNRGITSTEVLSDQSLATPASARQFILALNQVGPAQAAQAQPTGSEPRVEPLVPEEEATTYALGEADVDG